MKTCSAPNCPAPATKREWCRKHYLRWWRHGDPLKTYRPPNGTATQFIETALSYQADDCLIWPFARHSNGYPRININGHTTGAHRVICARAHGSAPSPKHEAAHLCGNGHLGCISPFHLQWKTRQENNDDKFVHGTHQRGETANGAKLTEAQVREIRNLKGIMKQADIAVMFGISRPTVSSIHLRKNWGWLP